MAEKMKVARTIGISGTTSLVDAAIAPISALIFMVLAIRRRVERG